MKFGQHDNLLSRVRGCTLCAAQFTHPPRPVFQFSQNAKIVVMGQAPGIKAHESRLPWNDASGDKLRSWLGVDRRLFYAEQFAHLPMAFCFPGYKNGADAPPPKICARTWHDALLAQLAPALIIHVGRYSQQYYLPEFATLTEAVKATTANSGERYVLPHPSGRNNRWQSRNPWFESQSLDVVRATVNRVLSGS